MIMDDRLSPPEQFILLDPQDASPGEALKIAILALAARGAIRISEGPEKGLLFRKRTSRFHMNGALSIDLDRALAPVFDVIRRVDGQTTDAVATEARRVFGDTLTKYRDQLRDRLVQRGFLSRETQSRLLVLTRTTYELTGSGMIARAKIRKAIEGAWRIPNLIHTNPAEAALLIAAAGSSLLLVSELRPHYQRMGELARQQSLTDTSSGSSDTWSSNGQTFPSFADFDSGSLSALDSSMSSFDSSFSSDSGGGGDSGGGDGGGGGD